MTLPIGILASAHVNTASSYQAEVLADSPTFYFPFNDTASPPDDQMNYVPSPTVIGSIVYGAAGLGDRSSSADFQSAQVNLQTTPTGITTFTVECLFRPDTVGAYRNLMTQDNGAGAGRTYIMRVSNANKIESILFNAGGGPYFATGATTIVAGTAYHVAMTYNGSVCKVYLNGVQDATATHSMTLNNNPGANKHVIGGDYLGGFPFDGKIAGAAFYLTALSAARIAAHSVASGH